MILKDARRVAQSRLFFLSLLVGTTSCHLGSIVGTCPRNPVELAEAQSTIRNSEPVVSALRTYYAQVGHYPTTLEDLVPFYLTQMPTPLGTVSPLHYSRNRDDFSLSFTFTTTCAHTCERMASAGEWECISYQ